MGFKVYLGKKPLTVPIEDENRAALAYNVLWTLADNNARCNDMEMKKEQLMVAGSDGRPFIPEPDLELNGTHEQMRQAVDQMAEQAVEGYRQAGIETDHVHMLRILLSGSLFLSLDNGGMKCIQSGIRTCDHDKAAEILSFLQHGMDQSVTIAIKNVDYDKLDYLSGIGVKANDADYISYLPITADRLQLTDCHGTIKHVAPDPKWAKGRMGGDQDFADAVAGIPGSGQEMLQ